jgi:hypothetical protein
MAQATNIDDLITLESAISSRQGELESLEAQQRYLDDQVSMSTISLYLRSDAEAPKSVPGDFWSGLVTGWNAFVGFWAGLLVVLGVLLPWLITFGAIAALIIWLVRRRRRPSAASGTLAPPSGTPSATDAPAQASERKRASRAKP